MKRWLRFLIVRQKNRKKIKELDHQEILTNCIEFRIKLCQLALDYAKTSGNQEEYNRYKIKLNDAKKDLIMIPITVARHALYKSMPYR